ncbi:MAG TPA: ATP-binding cassette domain-containing protein [Woeseiaceae bacterium]|nr:ATP-binding cassette domain-containing protein [Woeseiaceae bacterium]
MTGPDREAGAPLIEIRDATVYRGETRVLDRFSLDIAQGEQVAILGPNGAGKTTLLKLVSRELYPAAAPGACVRILGRERWNVWELRSKIGIVSHDLQARYRPATTALDVVVSGFFSSVGVHGALRGRVTDEQRERAERVLAELGVGALAAKPFGSMSTGEQRRTLLARALVHDPHTLVLDEPTAGLDLAASFDYLARIRKLVDDGRSIVLVTHLLNELPPEIERVILLRAGRVLADGPKGEVVTEANLERTYGTAVTLTQVGGYYVALPRS